MKKRIWCLVLVLGLLSVGCMSQVRISEGPKFYVRYIEFLAMDGKTKKTYEVGKPPIFGSHAGVDALRRAGRMKVSSISCFRIQRGEKVWWVVRVKMESPLSPYLKSSSGEPAMKILKTK